MEVNQRSSQGHKNKPVCVCVNELVPVCLSCCTFAEAGESVVAAYKTLSDFSV